MISAAVANVVIAVIRCASPSRDSNPRWSATGSPRVWLGGITEALAKVGDLVASARGAATR